MPFYTNGRFCVSCNADLERPEAVEVFMWQPPAIILEGIGEAPEQDPIPWVICANCNESC